MFNLNESRESEAQGALEYLIIIATVLIVSGVTVLVLTSSAQQQKKGIIIDSCRKAAAECGLQKQSNPDNPDLCNFCQEECTYDNGTEIFNGSVDCCEAGKENMIYKGSPGCD